MPRATIRRSQSWYGSETVDPNFYFTWEGFAFDDDLMAETRQRPKSAAGAIWNTGSDPRALLFPLADIRSDGTFSSLHTTFSVGGHLVAKVMTGVDEPENIVPVTKATNDKMSKVEYELRQLSTPHWLRVDVTSYYDEDPRVPQTIEYRLFRGGMPPGPAMPIKQWTVTQDWMIIGAYDHPQELVTLVGKLQQGIKLGWKIEDCSAAGSRKRDLTFLKGTLPPLDRRPLAFLDYAIIAYPYVAERLGLTEAQMISYIDSIGTGKSFTRPKWVRSLAIKGNILAHNNWLRSDVYGRRDAVIQTKNEGIVIETFDGLMEGGGSSAPQLDHIMPEAKKGPNCFSNGQITSQQYNSQKGKSTTLVDMRDEAWKRDMEEKLLKDPFFKQHQGGKSFYFG